MWEPDREFVLTYFNQENLVIVKPQGCTVAAGPIALDNNIVMVKLLTTELSSDGLRCEGSMACLEFEAVPLPKHKPHITCITDPPSPPPKMYPPPLPPPPPALPPSSPHIESPSPLPPPPPVGTRAAPDCKLGGVAKITSRRSTNGQVRDSAAKLQPQNNSLLGPRQLCETPATKQLPLLGAARCEGGRARPAPAAPPLPHPSHPRRRCFARLLWTWRFGWKATR